MCRFCDRHSWTALHAYIYDLGHLLCVSCPRPCLVLVLVLVPFVMMRGNVMIMCHSLPLPIASGASLAIGWLEKNGEVNSNKPICRTRCRQTIWMNAFVCCIRSRLSYDPSNTKYQPYSQYVCIIPAQQVVDMRLTIIINNIINTSASADQYTILLLFFLFGEIFVARRWID